MDYLISADIECPWCGEIFVTQVDTSQEDFTTIEDCAVCCRPIEITIRSEPGEILSVEAGRG
jgi:hypothetical protein